MSTTLNDVDRAPAIRLDRVCKSYGPREVIHDLTFAVYPGEIVGFLGPNGAGKTTTMRMIAGFTTPTTGRINVAGHDMVSDNTAAARHLGYLPEHPPLYDVMDVSTYLRFVGRAKGLSRSAIAGEMDRVIDACNLRGVVRREVFKLSKGFRQRLGLAQALLGHPAVLLLDEPTAGLDPGQIQETREVVRRAGETCAVLLSTHILPEATMICSRVAIIAHGRLLAIDSPSNLQRASDAWHGVEIEATAPAAPLLAELQAIDGVEVATVHAIPGSAGRVRAECRIDGQEGVEARIARTVATRFALHRLERRQPTLENIFLGYVGREAAAQEVA